jgi:hypothetical protein
MRTFRGLAIATFVAAGVLVVTASGAMASGGTKVCVPETEGKPIVTPKAGVCKAKYTKTELPSEEQATILSHMKYAAEGVGGKPTIQISGVNVQVVDGEGHTGLANGTGNLVIGYDEDAAGLWRLGIPKQTGSHNLVIGIDQEYTSVGGLVAGDNNAITAAFASVTGGAGNAVTRPWASVGGGIRNEAANEGSSIAGGFLNVTSAFEAFIGGGSENTASGEASALLGGHNEAVTAKYEAKP